ncbi:MAG TPA: cysteine desulfurase NifS [Candidatus Moranbacteria bacterium]|nr:cysteine desulfurase NifS [Candidatus Moranbacteria bacterium]HAT74902.1 cysteine desulfurase NifS [Candidatus Moranbacteria bacterium]
MANAKKIYLDYAATTPTDREVLKTMLPYFNIEFGNASSLHSFGRNAMDAVAEARKKIARFFDAKEDEIIFTSGATESNNLAIKGILRAYQKNTKNIGKIPHIITTAFEHSCILKTCQKLEEEGSAEITYLPVYSNGIVKIKDAQNAIKENTLLISAMYANNEIGTVQPIAKIGKLLKNVNKNRQQKIFFHTDATQAIAYFDCDVKKLGVDLLSMSAHKIYGPKGVGILYVKKGTKITRIQDGGDQEFSLRAGTLNTAGIVGLGKAIEILQKTKGRDAKKVNDLRDYLIKKILKEIPAARLNGSRIKRLPNNANFSFSNVEGESLLLYLDAEGIACSTGSACSSGSLDPSHVLLAIGLKPEQAHGSLRVSLGKYTVKKEVAIFITKLKKILQKLRKVSGKVLQEYYSQKNI